MPTAETADLMTGNKLYQQRARRALPLLVRQAMARIPITYSNLASELEMKNPRNLNYVLGCIGQTLQRLSKNSREDIPPIQCLVVNAQTGLPGDGVGWFLTNDGLKGYMNCALREQREIVNEALKRIYNYKKWDAVLEVLNLTAPASNIDLIIEDMKRLANYGGGEGNDHRTLKEWVANNPSILGVRRRVPVGQMEFALPSGDSLDVSFEFNHNGKDVWLAAEVKPAQSQLSDIYRGIFQCIKYKAVMEAHLLAMSRPINVRVVLVLGSDLPQQLIPLRNTLGVEVIERVHPQ